MLKYLAFFIVLISCVQVWANENMLSKDEVIKIGKREAIKQGYDISKMRIDISTHSDKAPYFKGEYWENEFSNKLIKLLKGKNYYVLLIYNFPPQPGGAITIFINSKNGNIIGVNKSV